MSKLIGGLSLYDFIHTYISVHADCNQGVAFHTVYVVYLQSSLKACLSCSFFYRLRGNVTLVRNMENCL